MNLTRRSALLSSAGVCALLGLPSLAATPSNRNLIIIHANGGWDTSYGVDPKIDNPLVEGPEVDVGGANEAVQTFSGIPIAVNPVLRPSVNQFFNALASDTLVVNGIDVGTVAHEVGRIRILTGTRANTSPDIAAIVGATHGDAVAVPYFDLGGSGFSGELAAASGRVGAVNQLKQLLDPTSLRRAGFPTDHDYPLYAPTSDAQSAIDAYLQGRIDAFRTQVGDQGRHNDLRLDAMGESLGRSAQLRGDGATLAQRLQFGRTLGLEAQAALAVDLLSLGLSRAVMINDGLQWDTHDGNPDQSPKHEVLFSSLLQLANGLKGAGLYQDTVVVVVSELGRTPRRNTENGKDHWPVTSALLFGGPVRGGRVIGGTTDEVEAIPVDLETGAPDASGWLITHERLTAGLLELLDVDPKRWLPDAAVLRALV
ncbi:MAG: DUF1501 domain-containing protein [Myxococcota bacterium]